MPLNPKASVSHNISEMVHAGHPQDQAIAAALSVAKRSKHAVGGVIQPLRNNDVIDSAAKDARSHIGPIHSAVAGRTDHLNMHVPAGAYVIPADIVSSFGEGNTDSGFDVFDSLCHDHKNTSEAMMGHNGGPNLHDDKSLAPIVAAGGEYVIPPSVVRSLGGGDIDRGHTLLDDTVVLARQDLINTLKKLPPPRKD